jgi:hypothetical protein
MVKAEAPELGRHFWLEIENKIFDITADQFDHIESPVFGGVTSKLSKQYIPYETTEIREELKTNDYGINVKIFQEISTEIRKHKTKR